ncbi:MAG: FkbM family methyltransferase [Bryobacteraceae bacterium]
MGNALLLHPPATQTVPELRHRMLRRRLQWLLIHFGPRRDVTVETFNGTLTFPSDKWFPGKDLYVKRNHEEQQTVTAIEGLCRQGYLSQSSTHRTVLNVGANIGMTCIGLVRHGYFDRAIAFEPAPDNYRLLTHNIKQNGLSNSIVPFQLALSSSSAVSEMELSPDNPGDHRIRQSRSPGFFREQKRRTIKILSKTLDEVAERDPYIQHQRIDLVWVDIQGHEGHFFEGARKFLGRGVPVVSEFWPYGLQRAGTSPAKFCQILAELFGSFSLVGLAPFREEPIAAFARLFGIYRSPREFGLVIFLPKSCSRSRKLCQGQD